MCLLAFFFLLCLTPKQKALFSKRSNVLTFSFVARSLLHGVAVCLGLNGGRLSCEAPCQTSVLQAFHPETCCFSILYNSICSCLTACCRLPGAGFHCVFFACFCAMLLEAIAAALRQLAFSSTASWRHPRICDVLLGLIACFFAICFGLLGIVAVETSFDNLVCSEIGLAQFRFRDSFAMVRQHWADIIDSRSCALR